MSTRERRPLCSYRSRRAGGRSSGVPFGEARLGVEEVERLRGQRDQPVPGPLRAPGPRRTAPCAGPSPWFSCVGPDAQAGQLAGLLLGIGVQRDAGDGVAVDFVEVVVVELLLQRGPRPRKQLLALDRRVDELLDAAHVALAGPADLAVLVRVDRGCRCPRSRRPRPAAPRPRCRSPRGRVARPRVPAATAWRAFDACEGSTAPFCTASASSSTASWRAIVPFTSRPSEVVMKTASPRPARARPRPRRRPS